MRVLCIVLSIFALNCSSALITGDLVRDLADCPVKAELLVGNFRASDDCHCEELECAGSPVVEASGAEFFCPSPVGACTLLPESSTCEAGEARVEWATDIKELRACECDCARGVARADDNLSVTHLVTCCRPTVPRK